MINLKATKGDGKLIEKIARRYVRHRETLGYIVNPRDKDFYILDIELDLTAAHLNGCPLKLQAMLKTDNFTLAHDISGIRGHLNRETGKLERCFHPRCAA